MRLSERLRRIDEEEMNDTIVVNGITYQKVDEEYVDEGYRYRGPASSSIIKTVIKELKIIINGLDDFNDDEYEEKFRYKLDKFEEVYSKYKKRRMQYEKHVAFIAEMEEYAGEDDELYYKKGKGKGKGRR